jgi:hypothetical protein
MSKVAIDLESKDEEEVRGKKSVGYIELPMRTFYALNNFDSDVSAPGEILLSSYLPRTHRDTRTTISHDRERWIGRIEVKQSKGDTWPHDFLCLITLGPSNYYVLPRRGIHGGYLGREM